MADVKDKVAENVEGAYYVDDQCISCQICTDEASDNFKMNDNGTNAFVFKQPENDAETEKCESAMDSCPVDAIGNDG